MLGPVPPRVAAATFALLVMVVLALVVSGENWVTRADLDVVQGVAADRTGVLGSVARAVSWFGNVLLLGAVAAVAAFVLRRSGASWHLAVLPALAITTAAVVDPLVKLAVGRPRPPAELAEVVERATGFPSGHSAQAAALWFALAFAVSTGARRRRRALAVATCVVALVGVSRVVLGVHSPTDVLGGWCLGGAIALLAIEVVDRRGQASAAAGR